MKRVKRQLAVRIMSPEDQHHPIMEYFRRSLGEPDRTISMKNSDYVEVFGDTTGGRLTWREAEDAADPSLHEPGLNSPTCERGIDAKFQNISSHSGPSRPWELQSPG